MEMPVDTIRAWMIGLLWAIIIPGLNQFLYFRYPSITIGSVRCTASVESKSQISNVAQLARSPTSLIPARVRMGPFSPRRQNTWSSPQSWSLFIEGTRPYHCDGDRGLYKRLCGTFLRCSGCSGLGSGTGVVFHRRHHLRLVVADRHSCCAKKVLSPKLVICLPVAPRYVHSTHRLLYGWCY